MPEEKEQVDREDTTTEESSLTVTQRWRTDLRRRRILIVAATLLVVLIIIFAILFWRSRKTAATATTEEEATAVVSVRVAKAEKQTIATQVNALGTIFPHDQALVAAKIGAQIKQMPLLKNKLVPEAQPTWEEARRRKVTPFYLRRP